MGLFEGFPGGAVVKNLSANAGGSGDIGLIPGLGSRKWQPTPASLLEKFCGRKELDIAEYTHTHTGLFISELFASWTLSRWDTCNRSGA